MSESRAARAEDPNACRNLTVGNADAPVVPSERHRRTDAPEEGEARATQTGRLEDVDAFRVFTCSALTDERLSEILHFWVRRKNSSPDSRRVANAMRELQPHWPQSFGRLLVAQPEAPLPRFWWHNGSSTFPTPLWGAFYFGSEPFNYNRSVRPFHQPTLIQTTGRAGSAQLPMVAERPSHGRIWLLTIPRRHRLSVPCHIVAFVANYCQSVGVFVEQTQYSRLPEEGPILQRVGQPPPLRQPYEAGFRFLLTFLHPLQRSSRLFFTELRMLERQSTESLHGEAKPAELILQYHLLCLSVGSRNAAPGGGGFPLLPSIITSSLPVRSRDSALIRGSRKNVGEMGLHSSQVHLSECLASILLSLLNIPDANYTIVVLTDHGYEIVDSDPSLVQGSSDVVGDSVFPNSRTAERRGLVSCGQCTGLTQFLLMILTMFRTWEEVWLHSLRSLDGVAVFKLWHTSSDSKLNELMFDDSFDLSRTYFATLQTLRRASDMVDDTIQNWYNLRRQWDAEVAPSGLFRNEDLADAAHNWDAVTAILEATVHRVQNRITRKSEDVKSLRDGLFNATTLREASKGITLNRAIYVFTVVTVLYTPLGFMATFWALPIFNTPSGDTSSSNPVLPKGFMTTFIAVPLLTYVICLAIIWAVGFNDRERKEAKQKVRSSISKWWSKLVDLFKRYLLRRTKVDDSSDDWDV